MKNNVRPIDKSKPSNKRCVMGYQDSSVSRDKGGNCVNMLDWLRQPAEED